MILPKALHHAPPNWCTAACAIWRRAILDWCARRCASARTLLHNAPYLAQPLAFVVPSYKWWEMPFYGIGLTMYDALAGKAGLGHTEFLSRAQTLALLPAAQPQGLKGGVKYWDGQFNDARLALGAGAHGGGARGALLVNYCRATDLFYEGGKVAGLVCEDSPHRSDPTASSPAASSTPPVFGSMNCARKTAPPTALMADARQSPWWRPVRACISWWIANFWRWTALMVPKTADGRVLFAVPWLGKVILGTTDTPRHDLARLSRCHSRKRSISS